MIVFVQIIQGACMCDDVDRVFPSKVDCLCRVAVSGPSIIFATS